MTAAARLFEDPQKEHLAADGPLPVLCSGGYRHIASLRVMRTTLMQTSKASKDSLLFPFFFFFFAAIKLLLFSGWLYNDIAINKIFGIMLY